MKKQRKMFDITIKNLLQIGSVHNYLQENWDKKVIRVKITEDNFVKRNHLYISSFWGVNALYQYLLTHWAQHTIHIVIWEDNTF